MVREVAWVKDQSKMQTRGGLNPENVADVIYGLRLPRSSIMFKSNGRVGRAAGRPAPMPDPDCAAADAGGGSRDRSHGRIDSAIHASWRGRTGDERNAVSDIELDMQYFYHSKNVPSSNWCQTVL